MFSSVRNLRCLGPDGAVGPVRWEIPAMGRLNHSSGIAQSGQFEFAERPIIFVRRRRILP